MGFTKLDEGILQSSIMAEDSDTFKIWITLLAACKENGIAYVSAIFLSAICHLPIETIEAAIHKLEEPDPHSRSLADDGRRIRRVDGGFEILNYQAYRTRSLKGAEAERKRLYRAGLKNQDKEADVEAEAEAEASGQSRTVPPLSGQTRTHPDREAEFKQAVQIHSLRDRAQKIVEKWNLYARANEIPWVRDLEKHSARERALFARLEDPAWDFDKLLEAISAQPFLTGDNERGWLVNFDWILKPANATKILDGAYVKARKGDAARRAPDDPRVGSKNYGKR